MVSSRTVARVRWAISLTYEGKDIRYCQPVDNSKYPPARCRELRAERGVGKMKVKPWGLHEGA